MICLIKDNTIAFGPASWNLPAILELLIIAGFDLREGVLYQRQDTDEGPVFHPVCEFPDVEPQVPLILPGFKLLPAVEVDEPAPEGKTLAGRELVILEGCVELRPIWADPPQPPSLAEVKAARCAQVNTERDRRIYTSFTVQFPDGPGRIQARSEQDWINIIGIGTAGLEAIVSGIAATTPIPDLGFKDEANVWHPLTPGQAVDFGKQAKAYRASVYAASWAHKDAINMITEDTGGVAAVQEHDITINWPEA